MSDSKRGVCMFFGVTLVVLGAVTGSRNGFDVTDWIEVAVGTGLGLVAVLHK